MKKDNAKTTKHKNISGQTLPVIDNNAFNQTIIINNPKININYIEQANNIKNMNGTGAHFKKQNNTKGFQDAAKNQVTVQNSSKGIDAWNLNKNLKEFSETRQLGFYKGKNGSKTNNLQQSPYLIHKIKTQDLKPASKLAPSPYSQRAYQPSFKQHNRTISTTRRQAIQALQKGRNRQRSEPNRDMQTNKPYMNQNQKFRNKKYEFNQKSHKNPAHILSQRTIIPLQHPQLNKGISQRTKHHRSKHGSTITTTIVMNQTSKLRLKNLEQSKLYTKKSQEDELYNDTQVQYQEFLNTKSLGKKKSPLKIINNQQEYQKQSESGSENNDNVYIENQSPLLTNKSRKPRTQDNLPGKTENLFPKRLHNRRTYQRSIDKISDCFLKKVDNYFDHVDTLDIPSSKIQLYASTINQPQIFESRQESKGESQKQTGVGKVYQEYDFQFEQEKTRKRPKTPFKRKKMYEDI